MVEALSNRSWAHELNSEVTSLIALFTNLTELKLWIFTLSRVDSSSTFSASVKGIDLVELHNLKNGVAKKIFQGSWKLKDSWLL